MKRVVAEAESAELMSFLDAHYQQDAMLTSSSLTWIDVSRAVLLHATSPIAAGDLIDEALSGIDERPITTDVVSVARRLEPSTRRTLDAIHLATAIVIDADIVVTYDDRLADACRRNTLAVATPGRD
ncbi:type II toxin-antitoxin system VapC family toxin [Kribbella albertanoniae]|nr:type II toxin-antitoxin system VapC family toxin [Kribbella albertanoniae]